MVHLTRGTVRMICLDLDGTLFTPRKEISGRTRKAIKGCLDLGMEVVDGPICSQKGWRRRLIRA